MDRARRELVVASGQSYRGAAVSLVSLAPGGYAVEDAPAFRVAVHAGAPHRLWEWHDGRSQDAPHQRGDVVVTAAGESRRVRWDRPSALVSIDLAPAFVRAVAEGLDVDLDRARIAGTFSHRDPLIEHLAFAWLAEVRAGMPGGALLGESMATALAVHLVRGYATNGVDRRAPRGGLAPRTLGRVVDFVHASLPTPIALADMARLADLSAFHFARQFRASTGIAPHAYVVRARVHEATRLVLSGVRAGEAAARVGFHSQGHLTRHMRAWLGVTPGMLAPRRVERRTGAPREDAARMLTKRG
ncbi:Transcriptional regulator, AraC family protein [Minicystis rosea]|nr:Transcriptional regulator, AraC family protein [Minicystis rosea]